MRVRETRQRGAETCESRRILQPLARVRETRKRGAGNVRIAALSFSTSRASGRRESAERATRDSRRLSSTPRAHLGDAPARSRQRSNRGAFPQSPRAHPRDAPARSRQRAIHGGFLQHLARIRETRQRGVGNARFAAAFFSPSRASARRESAERETHDSRRLSSTPRAAPRNAKARSGQLAIRGAFIQHLARIRETRQRGASNARIAAAFFSTSRGSTKRASADRATRDSPRFPSVPRAHPRDAPARSGQLAIRGGFLQHLARVCETRKRGAGNVRIAVLSFSPSRASGRRASAERATRDSRRFHSAPCARPRDAPARSRQRAIRGGFLQPLVRVRETRQRGAGNARFTAAFFSTSRASVRRESAERAARESRRLSSALRARPRDTKVRSGKRTIRGGFLQHLARVRETRKRGAGNARFAAAFFCPSRASARRESAERAKRESRRFSSAPRARPRDAKARSGQRAIRDGFLQSLARLHETRKRGAGNVRIAVLSFCPLRASARRESAEWATRDSRRLSSAPRARL